MKACMAFPMSGCIISANRCRYPQGNDGALFQAARTTQGNLTVHFQIFMY